MNRDAVSSDAGTGRRTGQRRIGAGPDGKLRAVPWYVQTDPNPAGSVSATARDLAAWLTIPARRRQVRGEPVDIGREPGRNTQASNGHSAWTTPVAGRQSGYRAVELWPRLGDPGLPGPQLVSHGGVIDGFRATSGVATAGRVWHWRYLSNRHQTRFNVALSSNSDRPSARPVAARLERLLQKARSSGPKRSNARPGQSSDARRKPGPPPHPARRLCRRIRASRIWQGPCQCGRAIAEVAMEQFPGEAGLSPRRSIPS